MLESPRGTAVNVLFTMVAGQAYAAAMVLAFFALAAIASTPAAPAAPARASAQASVRILSGARVHLGPSSKARMVKAAVRVEDGQRRPAYLIEFE